MRVFLKDIKEVFGAELTFSPRGDRTNERPMETFTIFDRKYLIEKFTIVDNMGKNWMAERYGLIEWLNPHFAVV